MSKYLISNSILTDIADSIREKTGSQETLSPASFSSEIDGIGGGADLSEYFVTEITSDTSAGDGINIIKKVPTINIKNNVTTLLYTFQPNSAAVIGDIKITGGRDLKIMASTFISCKATKLDFSELEARNMTCISFLHEYSSTVTEIDFRGVTIAENCELHYMLRDLTNLTKIDIRDFEFVNITIYEYMFGEDNKRVPANCLVIVKDNTAKNWILTNFSWLTNVKTVAEYEAEQNE